MGIRSKIAMLPPAVHSELDRLIVERAFSGYEPLAEWLQAKGYYVADDSVQRYGVRLRQQLEAIELVHHQAQALAASAKQAGETVDIFTALTATHIQQQALSILVQADGPHQSSARIETGTQTSHEANSGDSEESGKESGEEFVPVPAEMKPLDFRDLIRMTRMTVDLNRLMDGRRKRAEQLSARAGAAVHQASATANAQGLPAELYNAIFNSPLIKHQLASSSVAQPEPAASADKPAASPSQPNPPASKVGAPAAAKQSTPVRTSPQLTAPDRSSPQQKYPLPSLYGHPLGLALSCKPEPDYPLLSRIDEHRNQAVRTQPGTLEKRIETGKRVCEVSKR
jgi:Protein of unknown function (DUF3486)